MSLNVVFREKALRNLAHIRSEDKDLFARARHAISALADQPYPDSAVAWGATGLQRWQRVTRLRAALTGKVMVSGRRPWLLLPFWRALRLPS